MYYINSFFKKLLELNKLKKDINLFFKSTLYKQNKTQNIPHKLLLISCILYICNNIIIFVNFI